MGSTQGNVGLGESDVRPSVGVARRHMPMWISAVAVLVTGAILFAFLDGRRRHLNAPTVKAAQADLGGGSLPPSLFIPPEYVQPVRPYRSEPLLRPSSTSSLSTAPTRQVSPAELQPGSSSLLATYTPPQTIEQQQPARRDASPILVIDNGNLIRAEPALSSQPAEARVSVSAVPLAQNTNRARAGTFANRATTITQGTLIPGVLESALNSARPGFARAIVSRDVRGFDGSRVIIPRGSRLIGEYGSDTSPGQKRALINWTRLIRPDGATIAIGSPVADTLGRIGMRARVNTHFLERFSGAILQSVLEIGVNLASRKAGVPTIIALPGSLGETTPQTIQPQQITPTLTVKRGTSISVFVARDLDFTGVEPGQ